jgi:small subunit ribosomal protein S2
VKKLNDAGVFHYWQLAALNADEATKLDGDLKLNGKIQTWIDQARALVAA